ncbi:lantibiotic dehydratase [Mycobacterium sp. 3519A]|uniref:lantibiotic dehydratase n=1 Tax=Mycobacterium sp. 3519A TaxID=2057184 RepID=UPI000C7A9F23|nr:lantibiotic dehydratase [Mycobacterium sp. 3519A]
MTLYEPLDFAVVRAPLLPVDTLDACTGDLRGALTSEARSALAVASMTFSDALAKDGVGPLRPRTESTLRRYLIRMSTRPTPLGLFAGVGLASWGERTDIELIADHRPRRTRPDAGWLMTLVDRAESDPRIRRQLCVRANPLALARAGRIFLAERASRDNGAALSVSVRATDVVKRTMAAARTPIRFDDLTAHLLETTPGATVEQVTTLVDRLCEQTLLLTDLHPPLTVASPARYVLEKLTSIPAAGPVRAQLSDVLEAADQWDAEQSPDEAGFRTLTARANDAVTAEDAPLQVDSALSFASATVSKRIAIDAARAAELLLRVSRSARGPATLETYRRMFEQRYGGHREVPLVEMVDPHVGIGPLPLTASGEPGGRNQVLVDLAAEALRSRSREVFLDDNVIEQLATGDMSATGVPLSLDVDVVVSAESREAIDAGEYDLVVGPSIGSGAAGRMLGRFADFVPDAPKALAQVAAAEAERAPGQVIAELIYQPRARRLGNVSTRPNPRRYEIAIDVPASTDAEHTIGADELVVGVRDGRFRVRWTRTGEEVMVTAGHMLTSTRAPAVARFLSEVGRHQTRQLNAFSWGPAASFPFLPRVRCGRIVLSLAQWRLRADDFVSGLDDAAAFRTELDVWRARWDAPAAVVVAAGDHRLTLDLTRDAEELRRELRIRGSLVVQEQFPGPDRTWLPDSAGRRFAAEFVVPLIRRAPTPAPPTGPVGGWRADLRPPGSDWLFVKLYSPADLEEELLRGPVRALTREVAGEGFGEWFFIRYSDPRRHIRLRFRGDPERLLRDLLPRITAWASELTNVGMCERFSIDTYERELDRFGGPDGLAASEEFFCADSVVVSDLLACPVMEPLPTAVITVDAILRGLGMDRQDRGLWCAARSGAKSESGADYREWKQLLRPMLAGGTAPPPLDGVLGRLRTASAQLHNATTKLHGAGRMSCAPIDLYGSLVHLHLNRLLGADRATERRVYGLLGRLLHGLTVRH